MGILCLTIAVTLILALAPVLGAIALSILGVGNLMESIILYGAFDAEHPVEAVADDIGNLQHDQTE